MREPAIRASLVNACACLALSAFLSAAAADMLPATAPAPSPAPVQPGNTPNVVPISAKDSTDWGFKTFVSPDPSVKLIQSLSADGWQSEPATVLVSAPAGYATRDGALALVPSPATPGLLSEYGCTHIITKQFRRPQRTVTVSVFSFRDSNSAYGAYSTMRTGSSNVIVRGDASSEDDNSISFWKGRRFVVLSSSADEDDPSKQLMTSLADELAVKVDDHANIPQLVYRLPVLDRVSGSERLFMGPSAARRHVSLPNLQNLYIERARGAAFAEYQFHNPVAERMRVLMIDYGDPSFAQQIYARYTDALAEAHKTQSVQPNMQLCKLSGSYMLCSLAGSRLTIISGARKKMSPMMLSRQFSY